MVRHLMAFFILSATKIIWKMCDCAEKIELSRMSQ